VITKIISGGQTGADQAALDVAIELGIPHGGWVPRGRMTETGRLPEKYHMQEITSISYPERTELNVVDSDGTLIISHGKLSGGSAFTLEIAGKHRKSCLHIDLDELDESKAAELVSNWIDAKQIKILNVAGPRASKDPRICDATRKLLTLVIQNLFPKTVDGAVKILMAEMPLKDKAKIAKTEEEALSGLHMFLGGYIRRTFGLWSGNSALLESCAKAAGKEKIHVDEASSIIIRELWNRLKITHAIRAVRSCVKTET
jgi:hypothetical protein